MNCPIYKLQSNTEFLSSFNQKVYSWRIPINGGMDLAERCNLDCVHCYIKKPAGAAKDLPAKKIKAILDEVSSAGCLFFLMTGGEPLLRKDFADIYVHAVKLGMLVTVFSNGTLIDAETAKLFQKWSPQNIEISIYGATAKTHDKITKVSGSFKKTIRGVEQLLNRNVSVSLKTMLMTGNQDEFEGMLRLSKKLGVKFRMDAELFPRFDGNRKPLDFRVPPEMAVAKEMMIPGRLQAWKKYFSRMKHAPAGNKLYECAAGQSYFHINSRGILMPCLMTTDVGYDLKKGSFMHGWNKVIGGKFNKTPSLGFACRKCRNRIACDSCPSFFLLENGDKTIYSKYMCSMAEGRVRSAGGIV